MVVCSIGDLTLDVVVRLAGPVSVGGDTDAEIRLVPGGQGANVAAWSAALGARARLIAKRGVDEAGRLAHAGLETHGVEVLGPAEGRNGIICALVSPDGERSMASDRGAGAELQPDQVEEGWFDGCNHLFVSGYTLMREPARGAAFRAVELARGASATVSVDLASWSAIGEVGADRFRELVVALAPDVVFANADEERTVGGPLPDVAWILKRGFRGCSFDGDERPALPVERVLDSTGAGDALAAGFIVGGPDLALEAAARCVTRLGSMP
jgi:sugar/nucleoside kinase (ribokinase family)